ncbi:GDSL-type esterase/lipase family protein [Umezawaea sp.]|uniref:GDSL-type esterase/lipase family protein n=1 Tax=Umezawaea sp. TaxID=1955258 RepID=UPI002ED63B52
MTSRAPVVCFGDSTTEGTGTTRGYPDVLAHRLGAAVRNAGIAGNRLLRDGFGESGPGRFARDVLDVPDVTHVIVELGVNDLGLSTPRPTADELVAGLTTPARAARAAGVVPLCATPPPSGDTVHQGFHSPEGERTRQAINAWIRTTPEFAAVVDVDERLRDPARPVRYRADLDSGDHLHPNDAGAEAIAASVDLDVLRGPIDPKLPPWPGTSTFIRTTPRRGRSARPSTSSGTTA